MNQVTVGQNQTEMRDLAVQMMRDLYKLADCSARDKRLKDAAQQLEKAEKWRVRARAHGAKV